jgi:hypothetical protein
MTDPESADTRWTPPPWLRRLRAVTEEVRHAPASSPAERLRLGFELIAFAMNRLEEQAARRGCAARDLLVLYARADERSHRTHPAARRARQPGISLGTRRDKLRSLEWWSQPVSNPCLCGGPGKKGWRALS